VIKIPLKHISGSPERTIPPVVQTPPPAPPAPAPPVPSSLLNNTLSPQCQVDMKNSSVPPAQQPSPQPAWNSVAAPKTAPIAVDILDSPSQPTNPTPVPRASRLLRPVVAKV